MPRLLHHHAMLLLGLAWALPGMAQQQAPPPATAPPAVAAVPSDMAVAPALPAPASPAFGQPLQDGQLERLRGGSDTPWSDMKLSGTVANNSAVNVVTGSNSISEGSFANASGLPMVIQNSGANVLIQNATIINVQVK